MGDNADPWPLVDQVFAEPAKHLPLHLAEGVGKTLREKWSRLPDERRSLLKLISRFEINREQATCLYVKEERAKAGITSSDRDILANPYLLYEVTRLRADSISVWTVDRGVFPEEAIRTARRPAFADAWGFAVELAVVESQYDISPPCDNRKYTSIVEERSMVRFQALPWWGWVCFHGDEPDLQINVGAQDIHEFHHRAVGDAAVARTSLNVNLSYR